MPNEKYKLSQNLQLCLTIKILVYEKVRFKLLCFSARADAFGREFRSVAAHGNKWINIVIFAVVCTVIQIAVYKKNPANFIINTLWLGFMVEFMLIALVVPENLGIREVIDNVILCLNASYVFLILFPILFPRRFRPIFPSLLAKTKV